MNSLEPSALSGAGTGDSFDPCWSRIGVYGSSACPELHQVIHCRNCSVYASAAIQLLERPLSAESRRAWTEHFAKPKKAPDLTSISALIFCVESEWLALPTEAFQEVAERRAIHSLPHTGGGFVLGIANVHGELLTCISLCQLLGIKSPAHRKALRATYHRLLVVSWSGRRLAFPVDEIHGPYRFHPEELHPPASTAPSALPACTQSVLQWQHRTIVLLEPEELFADVNRRLT